MTILLAITKETFTDPNALTLVMFMGLVAAIGYLVRYIIKKESEKRTLLDKKEAEHRKALKEKEAECTKEKREWQDYFKRHEAQSEKQRIEDKKDAAENLNRTIIIFQKQVSDAMEKAQRQHESQEQAIRALTEKLGAMKQTIENLRNENAKLKEGCGHGSCHFKKRK